MKTMENNMLNFIKNNIKPIIVIFVISVVVLVFNIRLSILKKENESLKSKVEEKTQKIDDLSKTVSRLQTIINEHEKQKEIEDTLIIESQRKEAEINSCKDEFHNELSDLKENNDEVKDWCDQPIPSDVSTLFILGLR